MPCSRCPDEEFPSPAIATLGSTWPRLLMTLALTMGGIVLVVMSIILPLPALPERRGEIRAPAVETARALALASRRLGWSASGMQPADDAAEAAPNPLQVRADCSPGGSDLAMVAYQATARIADEAASAPHEGLADDGQGLRRAPDASRQDTRQALAEMAATQHRPVCY
jgi:hypothetical protein